MVLAAVGAAMSLPRTARPSPWISGEIPAAFAVTSPQDDNFRAGAMPSIAGFTPFSSHLAIGLRMRFGALGDAASHMVGVVDPGRGGLIAAMFALRFDASGTWIETDAGGGMTGSDAAPVWEVGLGHDFDVAGYQVGPMIRYARVAGGTRSMIEQGPAALLLIGLELRTGGTPAPAPAPRAVEDVALPPPPAPERDVDRIALVETSCVGSNDTTAGCPPADRDHDGIPDAVDRCPDDPETVNGVDDGDGCPDQGLFVVHDDRIVLDDRILFDVNRARIKHRGRPVIAAIAEAWRVHREWGRMVVEGHADVRGPTTFNDRLSQERAANVRAALIAAGLPADRIEAIGYGATRPRDPGTTEEAYQRNRRVEFVITHEGGRL